MERMTAIVSGRVQVVMYRDFACRNARAAGLVGSAENLPDGTVRIIAEGARAALDQYALKLWRGSMFSKVENVATTFGRATGEYKNFKIVY